MRRGLFEFIEEAVDKKIGKRLKGINYFMKI